MYLFFINTHYSIFRALFSCRKKTPGGRAGGLAPGVRFHLFTIRSLVDSPSIFFQKLNLHDVPFIGIAKGADRDAGKEEFYRPDGSKFALPFNDPVLYFVQRLRDEAHRFAITGHRGRRQKAATRSTLEQIPGIGPGAGVHC